MTIARKPSSETPRKKTVRILIMVDKTEYNTILKNLQNDFREYAVKIENASNVAQALYRLRNEHFDLILLDQIHGSDMTAKEVIETFRECKIQVPVVIVTGQGDEQTAPQLMKGEAYRYITKDNLTTNLLEKTIQTALERYVQQAKHS